ncbi:MAG: hypothetical protein QXH12_08200 [Candidatus Caldarchaeum sp.]|uniref:Dolichol kinase n=1 Tax=Caldiarchaeum subterraneum TaxID=311458 RepID=A0A7C5LC15_CALS0
MVQVTFTLNEVLATIALFAWVLFVSLFLTRKIYEKMVAKGVEHHVAVYYNRKIIHILAGGLVAILVPYVLNNLLLVTVLVAVLAVGNYIPHKRGKLYHWYQVEENMFEVHFIIMWGLIMGLGFLLGDLRIGILPILFMSIGDGVTGLVRNVLYRRRTKSWWGNLAMALFCVPTGFMTLGTAGAVSGAIASVVEKFEFGKVDDNITVPLVSFLTIQGMLYLL